MPKAAKASKGKASAAAAAASSKSKGSGKRARDSEESSANAPLSKAYTKSGKKKSNICEFEDCEKRAYYGIPDEKARRCAAHKENGWVYSVKTGLICIEPDCRKRAIFGNIEDTKPSYCGAHKEDDMVDLAHKRCEAKGCSKQATYGPSGGKPRFCSPHVPEDKDFVHISDERKAINEKCAEEDCKNKRRFGKSQQGPTVCPDHKDVLGDAAIDFGVKCLNHPGRLASHGISGTVEMTHCKACAEADEEELDEPLVDLRAIHKKNGLGIRPKKKRKVIYV